MLRAVQNRETPRAPVFICISAYVWRETERYGIKTRHEGYYTAYTYSSMCVRIQMHQAVWDEKEGEYASYYPQSIVSYFPCILSF